jgi:hypothetical protein
VDKAVDDLLNPKRKREKERLLKEIMVQIEEDKKAMQEHLDNARRYGTYAMSGILAREDPLKCENNRR